MLTSDFVTAPECLLVKLHNRFITACELPCKNMDLRLHCTEPSDLAKCFAILEDFQNSKQYRYKTAVRVITCRHLTASDNIGANILVV